MPTKMNKPPEMPLLTDKEILIGCCANCTREGVWSDEDCKYCQMNMRVAKRLQYDAFLEWHLKQVAKIFREIGELKNPFEDERDYPVYEKRVGYDKCLFDIEQLKSK